MNVRTKLTTKMAADGGEGKFTIDDAFESDDEDPIRVYGATTEIAPLRGKSRQQDDPQTEAEERENHEQVEPSLIHEVNISFIGRRPIT